MLPHDNAVVGCWERFLEVGVQFPWLTVLRQTTPDPGSALHWAIVPYALLTVSLAAVALILALPRGDLAPARLSGGSEAAA